MGTWNTSPPLNNWSMPPSKKKRWTPHPTSLSAATSPLLATSVFATPCELLFWWLLPSDGECRRASHSLHYYLARQGRRVVL